MFSSNGSIKPWNGWICKSYFLILFFSSRSPKGIFYSSSCETQLYDVDQITNGFWGSLSHRISVYTSRTSEQSIYVKAGNKGLLYKLSALNRDNVIIYAFTYVYHWCIHLSITKIYIALRQGNYSEVLLNTAKLHVEGTVSRI